MGDKSALTSPIVLVSGDAALIHLISTEAQELALPLAVVGTLSDAMSRQPETVLIDLDDETIREATAAKGDLAPGGAPSLIGFCRNEQDVPGEIAAALLMLIERPFSVSLLRQYMTQWSGYTVFSSQNEDRAGGQAYPGAAPVAGRAIPLAMEDEATLRCGDARISLTSKEAALMRCLLDHRGEIVGRDALDEALHSTGRESTDSNKTEVYLCFLRRKIERPLGIRLITTVRGKGYRLE